MAEMECPSLPKPIIEPPLVPDAPSAEFRTAAVTDSPTPPGEPNSVDVAEPNLPSQQLNDKTESYSIENSSTTDANGLPALPDGCFMWIKAYGISQRITMGPFVAKDNIDAESGSELPRTSQEIGIMEEEGSTADAPHFPRIFLQRDYEWEINRPRESAFVSQAASAILEMPHRNKISKLRVDPTLVFACFTWTIHYSWLFHKFPSLGIVLPAKLNSELGQEQAVINVTLLASLKDLASSNASSATFLRSKSGISKLKMPRHARSSRDMAILIYGGLWKEAAGRDTARPESWPQCLSKDTPPSLETLLYLFVVHGTPVEAGFSSKILRFVMETLLRKWERHSTVRQDDSEASVSHAVASADIEARSLACFYCAVLLILGIAEQADRFCETIDLRLVLTNIQMSISSNSK
ncbi:hypothetical protein BKA65DRAFT_544849 [Rhexocercosporidium sp. MPI-PUGE-AT-0058]|nr:hypothetical protein BKA65DRAFT_544849 [Rhexocercosporidium sp. MPI-PUGE-AT-0058]